MPDSAAASRTAVLIICRECGEDNWRVGPETVVLADYAAGNFDCEGCGRRLETGLGGEDDG